MKNLKPFLLIIFLVNTFTINAQNENSNDYIKIEKETASKQLYHDLYLKAQKPLYVINGISLYDNNVLHILNPKDVKSIDILKDKAAFERYGEKGDHGVIVIDLKKRNIKKLYKLHKSNKKELNISGIIYNSKNIPISNVIISNLNRKESFKSDSNGNYSLIVGKNDVLLFDLNGFKSKTIKVKENKLDIVLISDSELRIRG